MAASERRAPNRPAADGRGGDQSAVAGARPTAFRSLTGRGGLVRSCKTWRSTPMKKLVLETTAPFQGLPELVAYDEGLFEKEGLIVEWADRDKDVEKKTDINVISPQGLDPFSSHGKLLEQGQA